MFSQITITFLKLFLSFGKNMCGVAQGATLGPKPNYNRQHTHTFL